MHDPSQTQERHGILEEVLWHTAETNIRTDKHNLMVPNYISAGGEWHVLNGAVWGKRLSGYIGIYWLMRLASRADGLPPESMIILPSDWQLVTDCVANEAFMH